MSEIIFDIISWACFLSGGFFLFVGSIGMLRLGDFWARLHAASVIDSAGAALILLGIMVQTGLTLVTVKMAIVVIFLMITGPTATHAVANAAFVSGSRPQDIVEDETEPAPKTKSKPKKKPAAKKVKPKGKKA